MSSECEGKATGQTCMPECSSGALPQRVTDSTQTLQCEENGTVTNVENMFSCANGPCSMGPVGNWKIGFVLPNSSSGGSDA
eukprot:gene10913-biopygen772